VTRPANLHDVDGELREQPCHPGEFILRTCRPSHVLQLVTVNPGDQRQRLFAADRARPFARFSVEFGGPEQVRTGITHVVGADASGVDAGEQRAALQRVLHDLPLVSHDNRVRGPAALTISRFAQKLARKPDTRRFR